MKDRLYGLLSLSAGKRNISSQRLLCMLGADSSVEVIEEFVGPAEAESTSHLSNAVAELDLADRAQLKHGCASLSFFQGTILLKSGLLWVHHRKFLIPLFYAARP